ncbi:MAG: hypothetical protein VZS44_03335 [Bacilli bacterium]|nr:hypothetical protein [Bacilli bacterium]
MDYEYNGNLLEDERINQVANEIVKKYPNIKFKKAKEAAMLEGRISSPKTINDELNRLYNIMLVNSNKKDIVSLVYKDYLKLLNNNSKEINKQFIEITNEIDNYLNSYEEFPIISDYQ